jgi:acyl carrier protein
MPDDAIYASLTEIFRDVFRNEDMVLTPALSAKDVKGWDSFKHIEIMIAVEEKFSIKFRARELESLKNIGDLATAIETKTAR